MTKIKESFNRIELKKMYKILFIFITFILLIYRISLHADIYDEIINLDISYRIALGDIPFYNCWEAFQSGDVFMAPFLWIYLKVFNTTSGMILYSRLVYVGVLFLVMLLIYMLMKRHLSKEKAFFLSYIVLFFELYSLFYLWYDTVSVITLTIGCVFLVKSLEEKNKFKRSGLLILAGITHCCMAFSYPSFVLLALMMAAILLFLSLKRNDNDWVKSSLDVTCYAIGAIIVILLLLLYILINVDIKNFFETLTIITESRSATGTDILDIFKSMIVAYVSINKYLIPITVILGILYFKVLRKKSYIKYLIVGIIVLPIFNQLFIGENVYMGLANYLSYIMLWCPFLYFLIEEKEIFDVYLFDLFFIPALVTGFLISLTTVYSDIGPVKCWQACLPGALASLYYMIKLGQNLEWKVLKQTEILLHIIVVSLLINSYSYIYLNQPYITKENTRMTDGLYWGIKVNDAMENMLPIQNLVINNVEGCNTILAGSALRSIYLMTDLKPCTWSVEAPAYYVDGVWHWDYALKYFEYFEEYPDIMFLQPYEIENEEIKELLEEKYYLADEAVIGSYNIVVYKKVAE